MRVLLLTNHLNHGGITAYLLNLVGVLGKKDGFEYVVASRGGEFKEVFSKQGARHIKIPLTTKCEVSPKVFLSFLKLKSLVNSIGIDVIHANTRVTQVVASLLSLATGKPYISTCHGYFRPNFGRKIMPCWGRKVIAISEQVSDHLINDFHLDKNMVELIYNGIDVKRFDSQLTPDIKKVKESFGLDLSKKTIGHIGRLSSVKGQKFLILAASELLKERNDVQFLIIGDGKEDRALSELIKDKKIESSVFLRHSVKDTADALSVMDVFVMPSLQEGLGLSVIEAQCAGVPVVASRVGGLLSLVEHEVTGLLFPAADFHALKESVKRILDDKNLTEGIISRAKIQARDKFSSNLMAEKTYKVYEEVSCLK